MSSDILLEVSNLVKLFPVRRGLVFKKKIGDVHAVNGVSFSISPGETLSLVGESGSGKTTVGRMVSGLLRPTSGRIIFEGRDAATLRGKELKALRRRIGIVYQDPFASLNPRMKVSDVISEPLAVHRVGSKSDREQRVDELLFQVGLSKSDASKYPHQFSGGQLQRIGIARALALNPSLIIADEPVSALDVSVQAKIMNLMYDIQKNLGLAYLLISHDLGVVRHISTKVLILYLGYMMEWAPTEELFSQPEHPYTQALLSAVLVPDVEEMQKNPPRLLSGEIPSPIHLPNGCKFNTRCPYVQEKCRTTDPPFEKSSSSYHFVSCHFWKDIESRLVRTEAARG